MAAVIPFFNLPQRVLATRAALNGKGVC